MAHRIHDMRTLLREKVEEDTGDNWEHITTQIGMFCYTGLNKEQVQTLIRDHHIYMTADGRISMAGASRPLRTPCARAARSLARACAQESTPTT